MIVVSIAGTASQSAKEGEGTVPEGKQAEGEVKEETVSSGRKQPPPIRVH